MYSFRNYVFPISLEMMLLNSLKMNNCQYQVFELTKQIQCIVRKSISYVTYCADTGADRAFLLVLFLGTQQCVSTVKTTKRKYVNFILVQLFSESVQFNVHCFKPSSLLLHLLKY